MFFLAVAEKITGNVVILLLLLSKSCVFGSQEASQIKIYPNFQKVDFWPKIEIKNATFDMFCTYFFGCFSVRVSGRWSTTTLRIPPSEKIHVAKISCGFLG